MPASPPAALPVSSEDAALLSLLDPIVRDWWLSSFCFAEDLFTSPQRLGVPLIAQDKNVLICSPTGSGKTLAAFISIINQLFIMAGKGELEDNGLLSLYFIPQVSGQ